MTERSLLALLAHPDDEVFGTGGTLAQAAARGARVTLVCATRGEVGEISDPSLATPATLAAVREGELRCSAARLGISEVLFLDYRDSGMAGTPENANPRAFVNAPAEVVVPRLVALIRQRRPQVVLTFDANGGYGHPDHIAIHRHAVAAVRAAAEPDQHPALGAAWRTGRLLFTAIPRSQFRTIYTALAAAGHDVSRIERFKEAGWPDEQTHIHQDVTAHIPAKVAAMHCHATQWGAGHFSRLLPESTLVEALRREHFIQGWPEPPPTEPLTDIFAGL